MWSMIFWGRLYKVLLFSDLLRSRRRIHSKISCLTWNLLHWPDFVSISACCFWLAAMTFAYFLFRVVRVWVSVVRSLVSRVGSRRSEDKNETRDLSVVAWQKEQMWYKYSRHCFPSCTPMDLPIKNSLPFLWKKWWRMVPALEISCWTMSFSQIGHFQLCQRSRSLEIFKKQLRKIFECQILCVLCACIV